MHRFLFNQSEYDTAITPVEMIATEKIPPGKCSG